MLPKMPPRDEVHWTLDECDDADLGPESKRALGLSDDEVALYTTDLLPRRIPVESGEVPAMTAERARELLETSAAAPRKIRAA
jgi:hypothetical protein